MNKFNLKEVAQVLQLLQDKTQDSTVTINIDGATVSFTAFEPTGRRVRITLWDDGLSIKPEMESSEKLELKK